MAGIQETKEALAFAAALGNGTAISLQDGKFSPMDIVNYVQALTRFPAAIEGANNIPGELKDLDDVEREELLAYARQELDFPQDDIEEAIEDHLELVLAIYSLANKYYLK